MDVTLADVILGGIVILLLAGSLVGWIWCGRRMSAGQPILRRESSEPVPWGMMHLFLFVLVQAGVLGAVNFILQRSGWGNPDLKLVEMSSRQAANYLLASAIGNLIALVLFWLLVRIRTPLTAQDLGWNGSRLIADIGLGILAFIVVVPPVLALQWLLSQWLDPAHPLFEKIRSDKSMVLFRSGVFAAVVTAPILEEYLFRVLIQGWLEKFAESARPRDPGRRRIVADELLRGWSRRAGALQADFEGLPDRHQPSGPGEEVGGQRPPAVPWARDLWPDWPVSVSAFLFAMAHFGNGPDPIPLFFLAIGLGYLYERTHRIVPAITLHFLVNGLAMCELWFLIHAP